MINGDAALGHDLLKVSVGNGVTDVEKYSMQDYRLRIMHAIEINCHFAQLTYSFLLMSFATSVESLEAQKFATEPQDVVSSGHDTSLFKEDSHKTIFSGKIEIGQTGNVFQTRWAQLIKAAKTALPCWNVDTQVIWERFIAFNRQRGNVSVPAGYLLGFMRRWRNAPAAVQERKLAPEKAVHVDPLQAELAALISAAPVRNRQFHEADLRRAIGQKGYDTRICEVVKRFGCPRFTATLAVHGRAVMAGEILR